MKSSAVCHVLVLIGLAKFFDIAVNATPIAGGGYGARFVPTVPTTEDEHKQANEALYIGETNHARKSRNAVVFVEQRWPNGKIPYVISTDLESSRWLIDRGMAIIEDSTCVEFVPKTNEPNYVNIINGVGCYSDVGRMNIGAQDLSLGSGCLDTGTILHVLMQAVGLYHEHVRYDRDTYLNIYLANVLTANQPFFNKRGVLQSRIFNGFDYKSIMMHGEKYFSFNNQKTMEDKNGVEVLKEPSEKGTLTASDIYRVNQLYDCPV